MTVKRTVRAIVIGAVSAVALWYLITPAFVAIVQHN
jgi:hypothetical protein